VKLALVRYQPNSLQGLESSPNGTVLTVVSQTPSETIWEGEVKLPAARGSKPFRILVAEFEQHKGWYARGTCRRV